MARVIDAVLAKDEKQLLDFRVSYLGSLVDAVVIAEAPVTFSGDPKPLFFTELLASGLLHSRVSVMVIDVPEELVVAGDTVKIQDYLRKEFALRLGHMFSDAVILFQDIDEVPSRSQVRFARSLVETNFVMSIPMNMYFRRVNWSLARKRDFWFCAKAFRGIRSEDNLRSVYCSTSLEGEPGAHLSYLDMSTEDLKHKFHNYGHQEFNFPKMWSERYLRFCDRYLLDHLARVGDRAAGLLRHVPEEELGDVERFASSFEASWMGHGSAATDFYRTLCAEVANVLVSSKGARDLINSAGSGLTARGFLLGFMLRVRRGLSQVGKYSRTVKKRFLRTWRVLPLR